MTAVQQNLAGTVPPVDPTALEALMCRAGLAVAVMDGTGRLSMLSPRLLHLLHRTFAPVPAERLAEAFHVYTFGGERLLEPDEVPLVRASRGEVVEDALVTVKPPGQPVRHLRVNATPIAGPHGERQGAWAVMTDVTSPVAAARGELGRTLAETVNHNLRTPLTTMLCHAELLLDLQEDLPLDVAGPLQALWRAGQRLASAVTSISEWIDRAYPPGTAGLGAELTELGSAFGPGACPEPGGEAVRESFADRLLRAEDRERARIAADIHEDSLQVLGAVTLQLRVLHAHLATAPPVVQSLLDGLAHEVSAATDRLRGLLFRLEPTGTDAPIAESIRTQAAHIFDGSSIHWSVDDIEGGEELGPAERSQALRVSKEALSNVRAHSRATEVIVTLRGDEAGVEIVISDNGRAAGPEDFVSAPGHRGLETMRDRAADFGGRCTIEPNTPHGCSVRLYMPRLRARPANAG